MCLTPNVITMGVRTSNWGMGKAHEIILSTTFPYETKALMGGEGQEAYSLLGYNGNSSQLREVKKQINNTICY